MRGHSHPSPRATGSSCWQQEALKGQAVCKPSGNKRLRTLPDGGWRHPGEGVRAVAFKRGLSGNESELV